MRYLDTSYHKIVVSYIKKLCLKNGIRLSLFICTGVWGEIQENMVSKLMDI